MRLCLYKWSWNFSTCLQISIHHNWIPQVYTSDIHENTYIANKGTPSSLPLLFVPQHSSWTPAHAAVIGIAFILKHPADLLFHRVIENTSMAWLLAPRRCCRMCWSLWTRTTCTAALPIPRDTSRATSPTSTAYPWPPEACSQMWPSKNRSASLSLRCAAYHQWLNLEGCKEMQRGPHCIICIRWARPAKRSLWRFVHDTRCIPEVRYASKSGRVHQQVGDREICGFASSSQFKKSLRPAKNLTLPCITAHGMHCIFIPDIVCDRHQILRFRFPT